MAYLGRHTLILFALIVLSSLAYPACQVISSPGTYTLTENISGAPNAVSGIPIMTQACIVIASSNVTFDCDAYSITNNGTADATGILVNGSTAINYTNVTIRNCPSISGYRHGIYLYNTSQDTIRNSTAHNCSSNGIYVRTTTYSSFINNTVYNTTYGFWWGASDSAYNNITGNLAYDNVDYGFAGSNSYNNTLINNTAYNNKQSFLVYADSDYNTFINNTAYENTQYGFIFYSGTGNSVTGSTAYNNTQYGLYTYSTEINMANCTLYNNQYGLYVQKTNYTMEAASFLPETGVFTNYTNISITDTMAASEEYSVNWSDFSGSMPSNRSSFAQKYVNITTQAGTPSIDEIAFHWLTSELSGYTETYFELWKFNSSTGWTLLNNASDTTNNELKLYSLNPSSIYGILQSNESECRVISYPGTYTLLNNLSGANPISGVYYITHACIVIASSNVTFDCNGYSITNNGTSEAAGIVVNGSTAINYTNVTIQNCPGVSQYKTAIYLHNTSDDAIMNSTAYDCSTFGMYLFRSDYNSVTDNTIYGNLFVGIYFSTSSYNNISGNSLYNNTYYGYDLITSSHNIFTNNIAYNSTIHGFYLLTNSDYNTLINNTSYENDMDGFATSESSGNIMINNTAYGNIRNGFYIYSGSAGILGDMAYNNVWGLHLRLSTGTNVTNCTLYSNQYALYANRSNYTMEGTSFLPENGEFINYANLSITDNMSASEEYTVNWSSSASSPPAGYLSFAQKYVNITTQAGTPSIDEITFHWLTSELSASGYIESYFELWKFNTSSGWTVLNETPDIANNYLKLYALNPSSIYGILQLAVESEGGDTGGGTGTECNTDSDCGECYYCSTASGKCAILSTAECTSDEGCAAGYNCTGCKCVQAGCLYDYECPQNEYCVSPYCTEVQCGCGHVENHKCVEYECCADSDCPAGYSCRDNSCVQTPAQKPGSEEGEDGGDGEDGGSGNGGGTAGNLTTGQEEPQVNATEPSQSQHEAEVPSASGMEEGAGAMGGSSEPLDLAGAGGIVLVLLIVAGIVYFLYMRKE